MVEQLICNQQVVGSNPIASSSLRRVVMIIKATVFMAKVSRTIKISVFNGDTKQELYDRYVNNIGDGIEAAILNRIIRMVREEDPDSGIKVMAELCPFGIHSEIFSHCLIENIEDLCDKLAELTVMVLRSKREK